jgi:DNA-binding MarR family transcriptional regulator
MSIAIAKLVRTGYVRRERAEKDGRAIHLTLTAAGVRITEQNTVLDKDLVREQIGRDAFDRWGLSPVTVEAAVSKRSPTEATPYLASGLVL